MRQSAGLLSKRQICPPPYMSGETGWQQGQLIYGLWMDCNLMSADSQTLVRNEKKEVRPISEDGRKTCSLPPSANMCLIATDTLRATSDCSIPDPNDERRLLCTHA
jgi:hypothetical protein